MQRIALIAIFVALAVAQDLNRQTSWNTIQMTSGAIYNGTMLPVFNDAIAFHVDVYSIWIPETTSVVYTTFENTDSSACTYLYRRLLTSDVPCSPGDYSRSEDTNYPCAFADDSGDGTSGTVTSDYYAGDYFESGSFATWKVNSYWYFAVGRYYQSYGNDTCTYTLQVTVNSTCAAGSAGVQTDLYGDDPACSFGNITTVSLPYNSSSVWTTPEYAQRVIKFNVAPMTGNIHIVINHTDVNGVDWYGRWGGVPSSYSGGSDCYRGSYSYYNTTGDITYYIYDFYCEVPRAGDFYLANAADSTEFNFTISITAQVCPAGFGGYMCTYPVYNATELLLNGTSSATYVVPFTAESGLNDGAFAYMFMDIPVNYTGDFVKVFITSPTASAAYINLRKYGFPESDSTYYDNYQNVYGNAVASYGFGPFEYWNGGRWFLGMECAVAPSCSFTVSFNTTANSNSDDDDGGDDATTATTTGGNAAGIIIPSLALVAAIFAALL